MLVPCLTSSAAFHRGTLLYATPGAMMSGFATSPPRALKSAMISVPAPVRPSGRKADGTVPPTEIARPAEPGNPMVESPGPSFPAHGEGDLRMPREHRVHQPVDARLPFDLVAHAEAEVDHQRHAPGGGEADGVVHGGYDGAAGGDAAVRAV